MLRYPSYFPVALRLEGQKVVVVGGDEEAVKKAQSLLACGARVTLISPTALESARELGSAETYTYLERSYKNGDLEDARIAIVCDSHSASAVGEEAGRRGVLVNVLDEPERCDFIALATFSRDGLQFGVHSSGKSAALARRVRERLEREFGEVYAGLANVLGELRPVIRGMIPAADQRRAFWLDVVTPEFLDRVEAGLDPARMETEILQRAATHARASGGVGEDA